MAKSGEEWWGAAEGEETSWKTGSEAKRARMKAYIEWLLTPVAQREPQSKRKFADAMGVSTQTLRNYEKDPYLQRRLTDEVRARARIDKVPEILESLYAAATDPTRPSVQAAKVFLDYVEKQAAAAEESIDVESMDSDELAKLAVKILEKQVSG